MLYHHLFVHNYFFQLPILFHHLLQLQNVYHLLKLPKHLQIDLLFYYILLEQDLTY